MPASSFCASRARVASRRDAQNNERDGAGLRSSVAAATTCYIAAPPQQRCAQHHLRRSSISSVEDATRRMSATELVCAAQSQQRLCRSSDSVVAPSQQRLRINLPKELRSLP